MRDVITVNMIGTEVKILGIHGPPDVVGSNGSKCAILRAASGILDGDTWTASMRHVLWSIQEVEQENLGELTDA